MIAFILGIAGLFLLACLLWWWARGGVVPAIMMSAPGLAMLPVAAVGMHDVPGLHNLGLGLLYVGGPLAFAWLPYAMRQSERSLRRRVIVAQPVAVRVQ